MISQAKKNFKQSQLKSIEFSLLLQFSEEKY